MSNEAVVKPADIRAVRQRIGHSRPSSVHCFECPSPLSPGGSEERKSPKGGMRNVSRSSLSSTCAMAPPFGGLAVTRFFGLISNLFTATFVSRTLF